MSDAPASIERELEHLKLTITPMGVMRRARMLPRLGSLLTAVMMKAHGIDPEADVTALAPALEAFFEKLDGEQAATLIRDLFVGVSISDGERNSSLETDVKIDRMFGGRLDLMFMTVAASLEVNFGDFIERAKSALAARLKKNPAKSESPPTEASP